MEVASGLFEEVVSGLSWRGARYQPIWKGLGERCITKDDGCRLRMSLACLSPPCQRIGHHAGRRTGIQCIVGAVRPHPP